MERTCVKNEAVDEAEEDLKSKMSLSNLAAEQGQIGGWEFAILSFPR